MRVLFSPSFLIKIQAEWATIIRVSLHLPNCARSGNFSPRGLVDYPFQRALLLTDARLQLGRVRAF